MKKVVIIGGGFAGLWAAFSATRLLSILEKRNTTELILINKDPYHNLRPRFYENDLNDTRILLKDYLKPLGVKLIIDEVCHINHKKQQLLLKAAQPISYNKLIIASGSQLQLPNIPGLRKYAFNIDTYQAAKKLQRHINELSKINTEASNTVVVIGGGFTGVEAATDFMDRLKKIVPTNKKPRVIVIDRSKVASQFSIEAQKIILTAFSDMGIEHISHAKVTNIEEDYIELSTGEKIKTRTAVWTAGIQSNKLTKQFAVTLDSSGRLPVDRYLRIQSIKNCFAAGDAAAATTDGTHMALLSCQHAMPQGRFAGNNAIADLFDKQPLIYEQEKFVTCLDLGSWGALYAEDWKQQVIHIKEKAKKIKLLINRDRIYPPPIADNIDNLFKASEPVFKPIKY